MRGRRLSLALLSVRRAENQSGRYPYVYVNGICLYRNWGGAFENVAILVAKMLKAIHAQESKKSAREKAKAVVEELRSMKLKEAAKKVEDGNSALMLVCARLRHVAGTQWGNKKYMSMKHLEIQEEIAG